jgi:hypothetical protein
MRKTDRPPSALTPDREEAKSMAKKSTAKKASKKKK